jgi:AraC family transcriptional activator of tynA and feaB
MQTVYACSGNDVEECRRALALMLQREFTDGEVEIKLVTGEARSLIRRGPTSPVQFIKSLNGMEISFRRCWKHIQSRKARVGLLYFIRQGSMLVERDGRSFTVEPGRCTFINADAPFFLRTLVGSRGVFECTLAVIPEPLVLSRMPWATSVNESLEIRVAQQRVVIQLLDLLCFDGGSTRQRTLLPLVNAFLQCVSDGVEGQLDSAAAPGRLMDLRFAAIQACIEKHLTSAGLKSTQVAEWCGISPRYMCHVLRARQTTFSALLWSARLMKSREWLVKEEFEGCSISTISRMAGFRTPAHFSRMFKSTYGMPPKDYKVRQHINDDRRIQEVHI